MQYVLQFFQVLLTPLRLLFTAPQQLIATPRKMLGLSLAARIAILVAMFLVLATIVVVVRAFQVRQLFGQYMTIVAVLAVLSLVIPVVTYQTLKLWLEGQSSQFPDIDEAWQKGTEALTAGNIEITHLPLFLVVGSPGEFTEQALFKAARLTMLDVRGPQGDKALHWYATAEALYLVASKVGCLSRVAAVGDERLKEDRQRSQPRDLELPRVPVKERAGGKVDLRKTISGPEEEEEPEPVQAQPAARRGVLGTIVSNDPDDSSLRGTQLGASYKRVSLSQDERETQRRRLAYLCQLIRRARLPFCPINGLLALIPYGVVQRGDDDAGAVQMSAAADLAELAKSFRLRFPVVALVTGMESEEGFRELVRRIGRERATEQRFGKGFVAFNDATPEQLKKLCSHACNAFEIFIYQLFKEKGSLASEDRAVGNRKLFTLLCRIRRDFKTRLDRILEQGFGQEAGRNGEASGLYFGGCYFAATGDTAEGQGFVRGVLNDRLIDPNERDGPLYEDLEWAPSMLREDVRYRRLAYAGFVLDAILLAATIGIFFLKG